MQNDKEALANGEDDSVKLESQQGECRDSRNNQDDQNIGLFDSSLHHLLLLSDSAVPFGSFAYSAGLESFLAHVARESSQRRVEAFKTFLHLSLASLAGLTLYYVQQALVKPQTLEDLDNDVEASTTCLVAKRASVAQGRALLTMWQRSLRLQLSPSTSAQIEAQRCLDRFAANTSRSAPDSDKVIQDRWNLPSVGHFAPLFGVLTAVMSLPEPHALYLYLMNHTKTVISAAIRASVLGPYQAQGVLISEPIKQHITRLVRCQLTKSSAFESSCQTVPAIDIWSGRHELVYSRIFNS